VAVARPLSDGFLKTRPCGWGTLQHRFTHTAPPTCHAVAVVVRRLDAVGAVRGSTAVRVSRAQRSPHDRFVHAVAAYPGRVPAWGLCGAAAQLCDASLLSLLSLQRSRRVLPWSASCSPGSEVSVRRTA
jgi:hypothetical protein